MRSVGEGVSPYVAYQELGTPSTSAPTAANRRRLSNSNSCWRALRRLCGVHGPEPRCIRLNAARPTTRSYARNVIVNTKYTLLSFVPRALYDQFKYFFNLYFLLVALSQLFPPLQIGFWPSYVAPLVFVLAVTMGKEAHDDVQRWRKDREINSARYVRLLPGGGTEAIAAEEIRVGQLLRIETNQRVPADVVLLRTSESSGLVFLRTDQLDGETDWKPRVAVPCCQKLPSDLNLQNAQATVYVDAPSLDIYELGGDLTLYDEAAEGGATVDALSLENALWANSVLASGTAVALVVYTGGDTRAAMNTGAKKTKVASLDLQVNTLAKLLFALVAATSLVMVSVPVLQRGFASGFHYAPNAVAPQLLQALLDFAKFMLLFSSIIPISLRVSLDMAKLVYKWQMTTDAKIPGLAVRSSSLPEELGGIDYLLTDKTGTLTMNEMIFRKLHLGSRCLTEEALPDVQALVARACGHHTSSVILGQLFGNPAPPDTPSGNGNGGAPSTPTKVAPSPRYDISLATPGGPPGTPAAGRESEEAAVFAAVLATALCHNVSPVESSHDATDALPPSASPSASSMASANTGASAAAAAALTFQGASPDELALVQFAARCGLVLVRRTPQTIELREPGGGRRRYDVLDEMPFSAELKRMGILLRDCATGAIAFYVKGADTVMAERIRRSDWLEEEVGNLAREGLRTLVVACKALSQQQYDDFRGAMHAARLAKSGRAEAIGAVWDMLQEELTLLCVTAVEDKLQADVRATLERLRSANVRTWMLTGDKLETAKVIAQNASLVSRHQPFHSLAAARTAAEARQALNGYPQGSVNAPCLILDGSALELCVAHQQRLFMEVACAAPTVICCRCSPTQKAQIVSLIRSHTRACTAAIGDGGNDVGMIQAAHVGIGIEGREGRQAALAADFSVAQFSHLGRLVLWHGRNCYLRSATLSQFVIHRGLIISVIQAVFSALFYFAPIPLYGPVLIVGYATIFTTGPVFSLVLDEDVSEHNALKFPELYRELQKRRFLSIKTFTMWVWKAVYQGGAIMLLAIVLFEKRFVHVVAITFTSLILTELLMVANEVTRWHPLMLLAQVLTLLVYLACIVALSSSSMVPGAEATFDLKYMLSWEFAWRLLLLTAASTLPISAFKCVAQWCAPRVVTKLA